ncbi:hypothetical protein EC2722950_3265 [Escherichia coli 2722950]|nr:hypothetical protein EC2722950_3265 [Escherichia coli 2722950]
MEAPGCEERFCPWLLRIINGIHTRSEMTGAEALRYRAV